MLKKAVLAAILCTTASFASWDLFPVLENHKGQTRFTTSYTTYTQDDDRYHALSFYLASRYTVIPDLELALNVPYNAFAYYGGNEYGIEGTGKISFWTRYQFTPSMNVFADIYLPERKVYSADSWLFNIGLQFSRNINPLLNFGSELALTFSTKDDYGDIPFSVDATIELDFNVTEKFSPYIRTFASLELGEYTDDQGYQFSHGGGDFYLSSYLGATYDFNKTFSIDASAGIAKWVNVDNCPIFIDANLMFLFNF